MINKQSVSIFGNYKYVEVVSCRNIFPCVKKIVNFKNEFTFVSNPLIIVDIVDDFNYFRMKEFHRKIYNNCFFYMDIKKYLRFLISYFEIKIKLKKLDRKNSRQARREIRHECRGSSVEHIWKTLRFYKKDKIVFDRFFNDFKNSIPKDWIALVPDVILTLPYDLSVLKKDFSLFKLTTSLPSPMALKNSIDDKESNINFREEDFDFTTQTAKIITTESEEYFLENQRNKDTLQNVKEFDDEIEQNIKIQKSLNFDETNVNYSNILDNLNYNDTSDVNNFTLEITTEGYHISYENEEDFVTYEFKEILKDSKSNTFLGKKNLMENNSINVPFINPRIFNNSNNQINVKNNDIIRPVSPTSYKIIMYSVFCGSIVFLFGIIIFLILKKCKKRESVIKNNDNNESSSVNL